MFVFNLRFFKNCKFRIVFCISAVVIAVICTICMMSLHNNSVPNTATCDQIGAYSLNANTVTEQCNFLQQFGLSPKNKIFSTYKRVIPEEFNSTYEKYNNLQKRIGLDLTNYKGKTVCENTYELKNSKQKYAVLLIYKNKIIAGHLTNLVLGEKNKPLA